MMQRKPNLSAGHIQAVVRYLHREHLMGRTPTRRELAKRFSWSVGKAQNFLVGLAALGYVRIPSCRSRSIVIRYEKSAAVLFRADTPDARIAETATKAGLPVGLVARVIDAYHATGAAQ